MEVGGRLQRVLVGLRLERGAAEVAFAVMYNTIEADATEASACLNVG